ncbi:dihydrofolate reductase [Geranomyces variabilis]|uniref:Dihydrofolate reductase n=1 Tax=Geranomyces variabilis TaxID=109894 RepID=A0AAD5TE29_9FUNG|nr:dihydrofolate reductase [Geranomyces variabilis]
MAKFSLIAAALAATNGIGKGNDLPWRLPNEMRYFQRVTTWMGRRTGSAYPSTPANTGSKEEEAQAGPPNVLIMGRKTWDSMPDGFRPLKNRINVVLTSNSALIPDIESKSTVESPTLAFTTLTDALTHIATLPHTSIFIIGGAQLYASCITDPRCAHVLLTRVTPPLDHAQIDCDVFFPPLPKDFVRARDEELAAVVGPAWPAGVQQEKGFEYEFTMWTRGDCGLDEA